MVLGIDVAADRLNYIALAADGTLVDGGVCAADDRGHLIQLAADAGVVAIDAPLQLSASPETAPHIGDELLSNKFRGARCAEIALGRNYRVWVPWISPIMRPSDDWIATGLDLCDALADSSQTQIIETYPHGAFRALTYPARVDKKTSAAGIHQRAAALRDAGLRCENIEMWSHDSIDAGVAALVASDRLRDVAVRVTCGHDDSAIWLSEPAAHRPLVEPTWPNEPFFLVAVPEGWSMGPFRDEDWITAEDGSQLYADGITHPINLRIKVRDRQVLHANDGDVRDMSYRIVLQSEAPSDWANG